MPVAVQPVPPVVQKHALDPTNNNILPPESALVPFSTDQPITNESNTVPNFDILSMLNDLEDDDDIRDQQMVIAATQVEQNYTKTGIMKKNKLPENKTFHGCTFSNICTLNIHIHKH